MLHLCALDTGTHNLVTTILILINASALRNTLPPPLPLFRNNVIFLFVSLDDITVQFGSNLKGENLLLAEQSLSLS